MVLFLRAAAVMAVLALPLQPLLALVCATNCLPVPAEPSHGCHEAANAAASSLGIAPVHQCGHGIAAATTSALGRRGAAPQTAAAIPAIADAPQRAAHSRPARSTHSPPGFRTLHLTVLRI